jgi:hypothetical protein
MVKIEVSKHRLAYILARLAQLNKKSTEKKRVSAFLLLCKAEKIMEEIEVTRCGCCGIIEKDKLLTQRGTKLVCVRCRDEYDALQGEH